MISLITIGKYLPTLPALTLPSANAAADFMSSEGAVNNDNIRTCRLECLLKSLYKTIGVFSVLFAKIN